MRDTCPSQQQPQYQDQNNYKRHRFSRQASSLTDDAPDFHEFLQTLFDEPTFSAPPFSVEQHPSRKVVNPHFAKRKQKSTETDDLSAQVAPDSEVGSSGQNGHYESVPCLSKKEFQELERATGMKFELDGGAINSLHANSKKYCDVEDFLEKDISGKHTFVSPPFSKIEAVLKHYKACKAEDPEHTSICILVPGWQNEKWRPLLKGFTLMKEYKAGSKVFESRSLQIGTEARALSWNTQAFYEKPIPENLSHFGSRTGLKMSFVSQVAGVPARTLVDTGSAQTILTRTFAEAGGLKIQNCGEDENVILPDGSSLNVVGTARVTLAHHKYREQIRFSIVDLQIPFDLIIGDDWLTDHKAILQYVPSSVKSWKQGKQFVLKGKKDTSCKNDDPKLSLLTAMQTKRSLRKGCEAKLVMVTQLTDDQATGKDEDVKHASDEAMKALIEQYDDVFASELPQGVPQVRIWVQGPGFRG